MRSLARIAGAGVMPHERRLRGVTSRGMGCGGATSFSRRRNPLRAVDKGRRIAAFQKRSPLLLPPLLPHTTTTQCVKPLITFRCKRLSAQLLGLRAQVSTPIALAQLG